ncbi:MAG: 50S ribosomal protein L10 [Salibacteraceae bacterium]|jgi:large subunit ribosomal protein L10|nr:50S ribosomal protein L10 [Salibacteraceae bacterium]|tara:strand:- start:31609 stop:32133 length:525 start_codon:yes stop_codon:yes gene_type:complete
MTREEKSQIVEGLSERLTSAGVIYLADTAGMNAESTSKLRRMCTTKEVQLQVVKNTLLKRAMENVDGRDYSELFGVLKGNTALMTAEMGNVPAKLIKEFRKKGELPLLKGAWVEESVYIGNAQLDTLASLKSKNELIADVIMLLQSPAKNVISALSSGGNTLSGIVKTLSERSE